jgi:quercetin dioxygenase-like cupin family protein
MGSADHRRYTKDTITRGNPMTQRSEVEQSHSGDATVDKAFEVDRQHAKFDYESRLEYQSDGWMVSNLNDHASFESPTGRNFVMLSKMTDSRVITNCYEEGAQDEMHCHPGSEHTFLVWSGQLHLRGIEDGEEMTLGPGAFVQIKAGYYYQLHNPGPGPAVYCQFQTISPKPPKRGTVLYSESRRGKIAAEDVV